MLIVKMLTMVSLETFEELDCYKKARAFRIRIAQVAKALPSEEKYRLADQMIRAVRSITANIAEGFGRHHPQENLQFCRQSRGSLMETLEHLNTALDEAMLEEPAYNELRSDWVEVKGGYIAYLESKTPRDRRFQD